MERASVAATEYSPRFLDRLSGDESNFRLTACDVRANKSQRNCGGRVMNAHSVSYSMTIRHTRSQRSFHALGITCAVPARHQSAWREQKHQDEVSLISRRSLRIPGRPRAKHVITHKSTRLASL